jgi:carboxylate-amine ligase
MRTPNTEHRTPNTRRRNNRGWPPTELREVPLNGTSRYEETIDVGGSRDAGELPPQIGVEEEFLLVDPVTRRTVPRAALVLDEAGGPSGSVVHELFPTQLETVGVPVRSLAELRGELLRLRTEVAAAAKAQGCRVVGSGTPVLDAEEPPEVSPKERYQRVLEEFGPLLNGQGVCGCHVHVEVPDPHEAIRVLNHLRPWLPSLQALAANSPFADGHDTGYASWRTMIWAHWPSTGPTPVFDSPEEYDETVRALVASGVLYDQAMVYWFARRSRSYPTVEIRVADVSPTVDGAVLVAALTRGLVARALRDVRAELPVPAASDPVLRAAHWRAARDGLDGHGIDVVTGRPVPAWELVERLHSRIEPELRRFGDDREVQALLDGLRTHGTPADRQRAAHARRGNPADVVDELIQALLPDGLQQP